MHQEPKSHWALIVIVSIIILFGLFWYLQEKTIDETVPTPMSVAVPHKNSRTESPNDLQASVEAITIPDYSN
jgi:hypothetical protein